MDELTKKYRTDTLTPNELQMLRSKMSDLSDEELENIVCKDWENIDIPVNNIEVAGLSRIKEQIDSRIRSKKSVRLIIMRTAQMAAAILLPILVISFFYLYQENSRVLSHEMTVVTGKGERASVTLPDGTEVALNYDSKIAYIPKSYNRHTRRVKFNGEGYFKVHTDKERPFTIDTKGMEVRVLGTTFNLSAREGNISAELSLEEGAVQLTSTKTGYSVQLTPNQKAILNYDTGCIVVTDSLDARESSLWRKGDLIFRNEKLSTVLQQLSENYNYQITTNCESCLEDLFTGTLPAADINDALEVIEKSYHLKAIIKNKQIFLREED